MTAYRRMTWGLSLLTLATLGVAFVVISVVLDLYQERRLDASLMEVARSEAEEAPANRFSFTTRPGPAANDIGPLEKYGIMFDEDGRVLAATRPFDATPPRLADLDASAGTPFDFSFGARRYRGVLVPIPGYPRRRLLLAASRDAVDGDNQFVRNAMAIVVVVSVAWLVGAIRWLVRRTMQEHQRVAEILHRVATGDVKARISGDVSDKELRSVAGDIDEIAQRLAALIEHQRRFIAHAAHELRSPLAALHGEIQQALRKERSSEEYRKSLGFLLKASGRLKHLADELLELARAEYAPKVPEAVPVDLVIDEVIRSVAPLAMEKGIGIHRGGVACSFLAVSEDAERILRNLLDNAIRHSSQGGSVWIEVEADESVHVHVRDEGGGVPAAERELVFEPFYRSPGNRAESRGAGLGLAIARELARRHGGDLAMGAGPSSFTLSLPRAFDPRQ